MQRGVIDEAQAQDELDDTTKPDVPELPPLDPEHFAAELKRRGVPRGESWSRWIQRTSLRPGMDAKDWYAIYDSKPNTESEGR